MSILVQKELQDVIIAAHSLLLTRTICVCIYSAAPNTDMVIKLVEHLDVVQETKQDTWYVGVLRY